MCPKFAELRLAKWKSCIRDCLLPMLRGRLVILTRSFLGGCPT
jgi:hypothetical protein